MLIHALTHPLAYKHYSIFLFFSGDVIFVPELWGHAVLNLAESIGFATEFEFASATEDAEDSNLSTDLPLFASSS
jgi:oxalate decarboxylase/phosphoglucose isomerase-like protein (cupin superfamily)